MLGISNNLIDAVRESLQGDFSADELIPVKGMSGNVCSLTEHANTADLKQLTQLDVDGKKVFVYLKFQGRL